MTTNSFSAVVVAVAVAVGVGVTVEPDAVVNGVDRLMADDLAAVVVAAAEDAMLDAGAVVVLDHYSYHSDHLHVEDEEE